MNSSFYRIDSVRLAKCPPIGALELEFGEGINVLVGTDGSGKTSIVKAIRSGSWRCGGTVTLRDRGDRNMLGRYWAGIHMDERDRSPSSPLERGDAASEGWLGICTGDQMFTRRVSELLCSAISGKLEAPMTKFAGIPNCGSETFSVEVCSTGEVEIRPGPGLLATSHQVPLHYPNVESLFLAAGERVLLHLCGVLATREQLGLDCPLILDGVFGCLDSFHRVAAMGLLRSHGSQVIVMASPAEFESIRPCLMADERILCLPR